MTTLRAVDNGNSGDIGRSILVLSARSELNHFHLTEMGRHCVGSGSSRDCPDMQRPPSRTRPGDRPPVQRF
jgi:hypothetical protein